MKGRYIPVWYSFFYYYECPDDEWNDFVDLFLETRSIDHTISTCRWRRVHGTAHLERADTKWVVGHTRCCNCVSCHVSAACRFIYHSVRSTNGTFTTPNFPGLYPRTTECHYLFYGRENERIFINFMYFDIEGITSKSVSSTHHCSLIVHLMIAFFTSVYIVTNVVLIMRLLW
jgi:CUB domain